MMRLRRRHYSVQILQEIGTKDKIPNTIRRAKDKEDSFRLMGFGHRCGMLFWRHIVLACMFACAHAFTARKYDEK